MSEGLAQGPNVVARVGFEPATFRTQGTKTTTKPPRTLCSEVVTDKLQLLVLESQSNSQQLSLLFSDSYGPYCTLPQRSFDLGTMSRNISAKAASKRLCQFHLLIFLQPRGSLKGTT